MRGAATSPMLFTPRKHVLTLAVTGLLSIRARTVAISVIRTYRIWPTLLAHHSTVEFNIEGYPSTEFLDLVSHVQPTQCTLVPDPPDVLTSNAGWDLAGDVAWLDDVLQRLRNNGIRTSLFLDPDVDQVRRAKDIGADRIELYTERYAHLFGSAEQDQTYISYHTAALVAQEVGLGLNAGHDLNLKNLPHLVEHLPGLLEVSIGHALICDALYMGLVSTVKAYLKVLGHTWI